MARAENTELLDNFEEFFRRYYSDDIATLAQNYPSDQRALYINWADLYTYDPDLADDYLDQPDQLTEYAEEALRLYARPVDVDLSNAHVRVTGLPDDATRVVGDYQDGDTGSLLCLQGQVKNKTQKRRICKEAAFECQRCGTLHYIPQESRSGDFQEPHECQGCERSGPFQIEFDQSTFRPYQKIRLQVPPGLADGHSNESIEVQVKDDLVGVVRPGDRVDVNALLEIRQVDENKNEFEFYAKANSIEVKETDWSDIEIEPYKDEFMEVAASDNPYQQIVDSISPTHKGDRDIKLAIALQLFGGVKKYHGDDSTTRGNWHLSLIGDPGTGKSNMIQYAARLSPKSVYTSGKGGSAAGLTAACVRDEFGDGEWSVEGGAVVKANNGLAAIDELDKMDEDDRAGMFEALSEQQVSISKAGINATLPAETSLLAAANPEYGRFDQYEPIGEQIDLDPALISRFDLVFTVTDKPSPDRDPEIIEYKNKTWANGLRRASDEVDDTAVSNEDAPAIDEEVMRAYIAYAKDRVVPTPTRDAMDLIGDEFENIRLANIDKDDSAVPVTWRKQEAIQRIAEASARIRLSDTLTIEDAKRALKLVKDCLEDVGVDPETGQFDADVVETGTSTSKRDRVKWLKEKIDEMDKENYADELHGPPVEGVVAAADDAGYDPTTIKEDIEKLKFDKGELYSLKDGHVQTS